MFPSENVHNISTDNHHALPRTSLNRREERLSFEPYETKPSWDEISELFRVGAMASLGWATTLAIILADLMLNHKRLVVKLPIDYEPIGKDFNHFYNDYGKVFEADYNGGETRKSSKTYWESTWPQNVDNSLSKFLIDLQEDRDRFTKGALNGGGEHENVLKYSKIGFCVLASIAILFNILYLTKKYFDRKTQIQNEFNNPPEFNEGMDHQILMKLLQGTVENYQSFKKRFFYDRTSYNEAVKELDKWIEKDMKNLYLSLLKNGTTRKQFRLYYEEAKAIQNTIQFMMGYEYQKLNLMKRLTKDSDIAENIIAMANHENRFFSKKIQDYLRLSADYYKNIKVNNGAIHFSKIAKQLNRMHSEILPGMKQDRRKFGFIMGC